MTYSKSEFDTHLSSEHHLSPFTKYIREIVLGGNDGIVTTFSVVAGFSGANSESSLSVALVLLFGMANLLADGASMSIGNFLSIRANKSVYQNIKEKERQEIRRSPEQEAKETVYILKSKGFTEKQAIQIAELYAQNPEYWLQFMMNYELELANPENENPFFTALATLFSFVFFGLIPLIPFVFFEYLPHLFWISSIGSLIALVGIGTIRSLIENAPWFRSVVEMVAMGGSAGVIAYGVGMIFRAYLN